MNKLALIKLLGMAGAIATGGAMIVAGSTVEGLGVILASLSSANIRTQP